MSAIRTTPFQNNRIEAPWGKVSTRAKELGVAAREILAECQSELMRVRLEMAELKRIGSRQGLSKLISDASRLSMRIKRLKSQF
jgi:hypothetical protein